MPFMQIDPIEIVFDTQQEYDAFYSVPSNKSRWIAAWTDGKTGKVTSFWFKPGA